LGPACAARASRARKRQPGRRPAGPVRADRAKSGRRTGRRV